MFESLVLTLLERLLGDYVVDLDRKSLKVAVWAGSVQLSNLRLRPEACYALGLPVNIKMGCISSVSVTIPWSKLGSEPVTVTLDGVYLVAGPLAESDWDETAKKEWAWARKSGRLMRLSQAAELSSMQQAAAAAEECGGASPPKKGGGGERDTVSLLAKVLNNLQVSVTNIHVRYEDRTQSTQPFAIGVTLAELGAYTTDPSGSRRFIVDAAVQHKRVELRQLAIYHHCGCDEMFDPSMSMAQLCTWLKAMVAGERAQPGQGPPGLLYVIAPMSVGANVAIWPSQLALQQGVPRTRVKVGLSAVSLSLCEQQLRDATRLLEYVVSAAATNADEDADLAHELALGTAPALPSEARGRWRHALDCVTRERQRQRGWRLREPRFFERRRAARLRYTELWKRSQGKPWLTELGAAEKAELAELEREQLLVEDIVQFRALAKVLILAEEAAHKEAVDSAPKPRKTWYEWATRSDPSEAAEVPFSLNLAAGEIELSDEQRATLAAMLSGGAQAAAGAGTQQAASAEYVEHLLEASLDELSLTLLGGTGGEGVADALARLTLSGFEAGVEARVAGLRVCGSLFAVEMVDCRAPKQSVGYALLRPAPSGQEVALDGKATEAQWRFEVVQRPPERAEDWKVSLVNTSPLEVVHNAPLLKRIGRFFAVASETERAELAELVSNALSDATQALKDLTAEALSAVLARRTTTCISVQLAAPRLILPADLSDPSSPLLILDMGAISVSSATVAPAPATGADADAEVDFGVAANVSPEALYDKYAVELSSMQVLLAPADVAWRVEWEQLRRKLHVVYQFGLQLELKSCILPAGAHALEQFIVSGRLADSGSPSINVRLSSRQLRTLTTILRRSALTGEPPPRKSTARPLAIDGPPSTPPRSVRSAPPLPAGAGATPPPSVAKVAASPAPLAPAADAPPPMKASLHVQHVMVVLSDEVDGAERELLSMRTSNIAFEVAQSTAGQSAKFEVGTLVVDDRATKAPPPATRLLDSHPAPAVPSDSAAPADDSDKKLVHLEYRTTPGSTANELKLRFFRLHMEWNPDTVAAILAFVRVPPPGFEQSEDEALDEGGIGGSAVALTSEGADYGGATRTELSVVAHLESFSVSLNAERSGERLALLAMKELDVSVRLPPEGGMEISGQLGNLTAQDTLTVPSSPYEMLGLRAFEGGSLLTFEYVSQSEAARVLMRSAGEYDSSVKVRMNSVHVAFWYPAVMRLVHYLMSGVLGALMSATANTVAQMARSVLDSEVSAMSLDVEVGSPLVLLPTAAGGSVGLRADLGRITVRNSLVQRQESVTGSYGLQVSSRNVTVDAIRVMLEDMHIDSIGDVAGSGAAEGALQMLRDVALEVTVERGLGLSAGLGLRVDAETRELAVDCSKAQYELLMRMLVANLARRSDRFWVAEQQASAARAQVADSSVSTPYRSPSADGRRDGLLSGGPATSQSSATAALVDAPPDMVVKFSLPLLKVRLSDVGPFGEGRPIAGLQLRDARVRYSSITDGPSETRLCVRALHVLDELRGGHELLRTVPPDAAPPDAADARMSELADLLYKSTDPGEPNELRLTFSRLHVEWNPETVAALLAFVRRPPEQTPPPPSPAALRFAHNNASSSSSVATSMYLSAVEFDERGAELPPLPGSFGGEEVRSEGGDDVGAEDGGPGDALSVVAHLESFSVSLNAERSGERLALLAMKELDVSVRLPPEGGMEISGQLGNLTAQDTLTVPSSPYEMLGLRAFEGGSLLTFEYVSQSEAARVLMRSAGEYDSSVKVRMNSVHVAFWYPAVMRLVHYLMSGVLGALMSATANTVAQMARSVLDSEVSAMSLDVEVGSPLVLLPTAAGGSVGLRADLGRITVRNSLVQRAQSKAPLFGVTRDSARQVTLDTIHVVLEDMKVDAVGQASGDDCLGQLLRDLSFDVQLERGIGSSADLPLSVQVRGGEIACDVSKAQYQRLMHILMANLGSRGDALAMAAAAVPSAADVVDTAASSATMTPESVSGSRAARRARASAAAPATAPLFEGAESTGPSLSISATVELAGAAVRLSDERGRLLAAALRGFSVEYKHYSTSDMEVTLACRSVELTSTRASSEQG